MTIKAKEKNTKILGRWYVCNYCSCLIEKNLNDLLYRKCSNVKSSMCLLFCTKKFQKKTTFEKLSDKFFLNINDNDSTH